MIKHITKVRFCKDVCKHGPDICPIFGKPTDACINRLMPDVATFMLERRRAK